MALRLDEHSSRVVVGSIGVGVAGILTIAALDDPGNAGRAAVCCYAVDIALMGFVYSEAIQDSRLPNGVHIGTSLVGFLAVVAGLSLSISITSPMAAVLFLALVGLATMLSAVFDARGPGRRTVGDGPVTEPSRNVPPPSTARE
jgi:hypothetical protein